jgi:hypothetical protein
MLLDTRKWILERAGYRVSAVADLAAAEAILATEGSDLYMLCHTLSAELRERALATAHERRPAMRSLILSHGDLAESVGETDSVFYVFEGPRAMIATANKISGRPATMSS